MPRIKKGIIEFKQTVWVFMQRIKEIIVNKLRD